MKSKYDEALVRKMGKRAPGNAVVDAWVHQDKARRPSTPRNTTCVQDFIQERSFLEVSELLCQESTAHGVGHAWNNRNNVLGLVWLSATVCFAVYLSYVCTMLFLDFAKREVESQTTVLVPSAGLPLPSILICNRSFFSKKKLQALNISDTLGNYLMALTGTPSLVKESFLSSQAGKDFLKLSDAQVKDLMRRNNMTHFSQLIEAISYRCEDLVLRCAVGPIQISQSECCAGFLRVPSMSGECLLYYNDGLYMQTIDGEYMGFTVYFSLPYNDTPVVVSEVLDLTGWVKTGLQVSFMSNLTHPAFLAVGQGVQVAPAHSTFVDLSITTVIDTGMKTMFDPTISECVPLGKIGYLKDKDHFFFTEPNCDLALVRQCFLSVCNCTYYGFDYPKDFPVPQCTLAQSITCYSASMNYLNITNLNATYNSQGRDTSNRERVPEACWAMGLNKCHRSCVRYDYTYTSSKLILDENVYRALKKQFNLSIGTDIAILKSYFPTLRYVETRVWRRSIESLISTLGGYSGLFLGASLITVVEVFIFIGLFIAVLVRNIKRKLNGRPIRNATHPEFQRTKAGMSYDGN